MKAAQITKHSKSINLIINNVDMPVINEYEVLIKVKAAGVNPVDILIAYGSIRMIQNYKFPLTLGNELSGVIEKVGSKVREYKIGDNVMTRMPINKIGAFAEYVAVNSNAIAIMPKNMSYVEAAAVPLTGLTAYQVLNDVLKVKSHESIFLPGGTGGLGGILIPIAKKMELKVITNGSENGYDRLLKMGVDKYINYKEENYEDILSNIDYVIDTLGPNDIDKELKILKPHGKIVSLKGIPNYKFALENRYPLWKRLLFKLVGNKYDRMASKQDKEYYFFFVKENGEQLAKVSNILESHNIKPAIDSVYDFTKINEALEKVSQGHAQGKIVITFK
ncbi:MAG: NADP-dependent oxidoreductase [Fusobacteriaceae bacterium]|jgi:NADPH:quinone reductase-like Zn-dependent oxidoreductase|nr:NADP-dependent oxidoreductase [Fusobacteriaceae bacterium]MBP8762956.1 NADP-dependent oxidoreductase [Acetoanaerobium sp.]MBP9562182.1 NADP-dependent oxidoreductase [Acetoanaerobium sp.]